MADVFLSYKRDERAAVETIASRLRDLGLTVWFDASMSAGETFNAEIDREARAAKAILVCWSPAARKSEWVNAEAMIGFEEKKLAACYVAGPDRFSLPTPFNATHAEDLRAWLTAPCVAHSGWKSVLRRLGKLCGRGDIQSYGAIDAHASTSDLSAWIDRYGGSPLFMPVELLLKAREAEEAERARLEAEARARRHSEAVERRAQEAADRLAYDERARLERAQKEEAEARKQAWDRCWQEANQIVACQRKAYSKHYAETRVWGFYWIAVFCCSVPFGILSPTIVVPLFSADLVSLFPFAWLFDQGRRSEQAQRVYNEEVLKDVADRLYLGQDYESYLRQILQQNVDPTKLLDAAVKS
ncbi:MAG: toll/interleukin-1 receptor domain-containing protein [Terricaulis sp.]